MEESRALSDVCRTLKVISDKKTEGTKERIRRGKKRKRKRTGA
jgi:hypothetical protein